MEIEAGDRLIKAEDLPGYLNKEFWQDLILWSTCRLLGGDGTLAFPYAGGWAEQPESVINVLIQFQRLENEARAKEIERSRKKNGNRGRNRGSH